MLFGTLLKRILGRFLKKQKKNPKTIQFYRCNEGVLCESKTSYSTSSIFLKLCCVFCSWFEIVHVVNNKKKIGGH